MRIVNLFPADGSNNVISFDLKAIFDKNEYQKNWFKNNPEKRAKHQKKYRENKKSEIAETKANWYRLNAERLKKEAREKYKYKILSKYEN